MRAYLRLRLRVFIMAMLFFVIFLCSFILYRLPLKAVWYPCFLCLILGVVFVVIDYYRVKEKCNKLNDINSAADIVENKLPLSEDVISKSYERIIELLVEEECELRNRTGQRFSDMMEYYSVWAHQIKTPIASMGLHLQNEDSELSRKLSSDLFRIEQYVEMVMAFLRMDSENSDYLFKEYDLDSIIKQGIKRFAGEFIERKIRLIYEPLNETVLTDEKWLLFVIEQILSNALKYTKSGSITIEAGKEKQLRIIDTGIGIAPEDLPRIFEHGYTGYNGRLDKKASGIGLYLCKRICTKLGHGIKVESQPGVGTCVILELKREKGNYE